MGAELRDKRWAEWKDDVVVAFEKPNELNIPDVRDVLNEQGLVSLSYLTGCKTCQQIKSKCVCASPNLNELLIYDRAAGLRGFLWRKYFEPLDEKIRVVHPKYSVSYAPPIDTEKKKLTVEELASVLPDVDELLTGGTEKSQEAREYFGAPGAFLEYITNPKTHATVYFTYPQDKLEELTKLFSKHDKKLTVRPLALPGPETKTARGLSPGRGGVSATIQFPTPKDEELLKQLAYYYPKEINADAPYTILHDSKLVLHLILISGYTQDSPLGPRV